MALNWELHPEYCSNQHIVLNSYGKPETLDKMLSIASALSTPFPFVRVDFYDINGKPILGEMSFTPGSDTYNSLFNQLLRRQIII